MNATIRQMADEVGLSRMSEELTSLLLSSLRLHTRPVDDSEISIGASKLGGPPDLPQRTPWPVWDNRPLNFIAQINLNDIRSDEIADLVPGRGLLSFFYDTNELPWGFDPKDQGGGKVLYHDGPVSELTRTMGPIEAEQFSPCIVAHSPEWTLPSWDSVFIERLDLTEDEQERYSNLRDKLAAFYGADEPVHRLLGYADPVQGEMELQCQLVSNGLYCGDESGYRDPRAVEMAAGMLDWQLLLQVDSDDDAGMMWGDLGMIYFWIRRQELQAGDFENVWVILQCT